MEPLKELIARMAKPGRIDWIGLRPARRTEIEVVPQANLSISGIEGDHGRAGKRAVTLLQSEHLAVIASFLERDQIGPEILRRNVLISGINLSALRGRQMRLCTAVIEITGVCAPCSRMEEALGYGGYSALRGHGGWTASVIEPGTFAVGGQVAVLD